MCGFFGMVSRDRLPGDDVLYAASRHAAYRGRDGEGVFNDGGCYLAHYRLSIIDLETGGQPMRDVSGRYVAAFNGELFNYVELKSELESLGHRFATTSDTEVFITGVAEFGGGFLKKAEGMFAAAVWDTRDRALTLVRDPLGKKPLFVCELQGGVAFGSSLASFKELPGWKREINGAGVVSFVQYGFIPAPLTIYKNSRRVSPGSIERYECETGRWTTVARERLSFSDSRRVDEDGVYAGLREAVSIRLRTDVPLGMTFSGGVDSGLLACIVKELGARLKLFNIDYENDNNLSPERRNARDAAGRLGFELLEDNFNPEALFSSLADSYRHYDEPCSQLPVVYAYQILKSIRAAGYKVVIAGNGGDEIFFGYNGNRMIRVKSDLLRFALPAAPLFALRGGAARIKKDGMGAYFYEKETAALREKSSAAGLADGFVDDAAPYLDELKKALDEACFKRYSDYVMWRQLYFGGATSNYLLPDISGMQAQVEVRAPMLDWRFINAVKGIPDPLRIGSYRSDRLNKAALKKMYADRLGRELAYDAKRGMAWNIRWDKWMIHEQAVNDAFRRAYRALDGYGVSPAWFEGHFDNYCAADKYASSGADESVYGFMLALWFIKEFEGEGALEEFMSPLADFKPAGVYA